MVKPALGRGLGALLGGAPVAKPSVPPSTATDGRPSLVTATSGENVHRVPLERIRPCPLQPRKEFSAEALEELANSIREQGIVQPLVVREVDGFYQLIAGERRWRAAQAVGLKEVPVLLRQADDRTVLELALIENLQRENLNPIEEAHGFAQLISQFRLTQEEAALKVGKNRVTVNNALRLLKLPPSVQESIREGSLSTGHAKAIIGLPDPRDQQLVAQRIIKAGLSVRQAEVMVAKLRTSPAPENSAAEHAAAAKPADAHVRDVEDQLRERLGTKVHLRYSEGKGTVEIAFFSDVELERILGIIGISTL